MHVAHLAGGGQTFHNPDKVRVADHPDRIVTFHERDPKAALTLP
jgi:hypothetical protein